MTGYSLQSGEALIHRQEQVALGSKASFSGELILTNQNLVFVRRGFFGGAKGVHIMPLQQLKIFQGRTQAVATKQRNMAPSLDVYFDHGMEQFRFVNHRDAKYWSEKINEVVTGTRSMRVSTDASMIDKAAETVKDTLDAFKGALGIKASMALEASATIAGDCDSCGAPVSGLRGQAVSCSYCDMATQL